MKIRTSFGRTTVALACLVCVLVPFAAPASAERSAARPAQLTTLDEAVAAGRLDAAVVRELRDRGHADAIVTFEYKEILDGAERAAPAGAGRAARLVDLIEPALADRKAGALGVLHAAGSGTVIEDYEFLPVSYVRFESAQALLTALNADGVTGIGGNGRGEAALAQTLPLVRQPLAADSGYSGAGTEVAVIDGGVQLANFGCAEPGGSCRISEALDYADGVVNGFHGTNVAGIVEGVAPGAKIISMDIGDTGPNSFSWVESDLIDAINDVITRRRQGRNIRAVNMSLLWGTLNSPGTCSTSPGTGTANPFTAAFDTLRRAGILPVVSSGNFPMPPGSVQGISYPACTAGAVSVGAVYDANVGATSFPYGCGDPTTAADQIACFSQTSANLTMLAPGVFVDARGTVNFSGTSMAAPHVAGAAAVLAAAKSDAPASTIEQALANNGPRITDPRNGVTKRRLDMCEALQGLLGRATARVTSFTLGYTAGACENNDVTVSLAGGVYTITDIGASINPDNGVAITAAAGCSPVAGNVRQVTCSASGVSRLSISVGDRNDSVSVTAATPATILGGPGDDTLNGGSAIDTLSGEDGRDRLDGGDGNDVLRGGLGADILKGSAGTDQADYLADVPGGRSLGVSVTIDDAANDGQHHEVDNVLTDVEWVLGTTNGDSLSGSTASNILWGSAGADTLRGGGGNDTIYGEAGADLIYGDDGADTLQGGNENDELHGGVQGDVLNGGSGRDTLFGEDGGDFLDGGPGSAIDLADTGDTFSGGAGVDRATFSTHFTGVEVSLDGVANDGAAGEADNVLTDVENLSGSSFADTLRGSKGDNEIRGQNGNDTVVGGLGADLLFGDDGNDVLEARSGTAFFADIDGRVDCGVGTSDTARIDNGDPVFGCELLT
jgi:Ca2+-binding RTX toxin-like protein